MERRVISIITDNEFGSLARIVTFFSSRGYNIDSLSVAVVDEVNNLSRVNIETSGNCDTLNLIVKLVEKIIPVHEVKDLTSDGNSIEKMLCLCKVGSKSSESDARAMEVGKNFDTEVLKSGDSGSDLVFQIVGDKNKIDEFLLKISEFDVKEISKTGFAALSCA